MTRLGLRVRDWWAALTAVLMVAAGGAIVLPTAPVQAAPLGAQQSTPTAKAQAASHNLSCEPGVVYSVSRTGQLRKIVSGSSSPVGSPASGVNNFNGLGIGVGVDGNSVFAVERTSSSGYNIGARVYVLNVGTGAWSSTNASIGDTGTNLVAGAVDLKSGTYYFGGFTSTRTQFKIFRFNESSSSVNYVGWIDTNAYSQDSANGDMAFDSSGNLLVVRGTTDYTTVFSVTQANLAGAAGGKIPSAMSTRKRTNSNVNGVAFDADGKAYLGTQTDIVKYAMPGWNSEGTFASGSWGSTDLASCSAPTTITLQKDVVGARAKADDQFELRLEQEGAELGKAVTEGTKLGLQEEIVGPLPTGVGEELTLSESGTGATDLHDYESSYSCAVKGSATFAKASASSGTVTIPTNAKGKEVVCTIMNSPLTANVSIHKDVVDENGENKKPGKDWTVGAKATATTDSVTANPTAATKKTDSNGDAKWGLKFSKTTGRATVAISETQQDGFEFKEGSCSITHIDGSKDTKKLTSDKSTDLTGIKPGDTVDCTYVNKVSDTALTLVKKVDNKAAAGTAKDTDWTLKAAGDVAAGNKTIEGKTGSSEVTKAKVKAGKYALSETGTPKGYEASDWVCKPTSGSGVVTSDKSSVTLKSGDDVTCTITNTAKTGAVTWGKTNESGNDLKGSVWTLTGPDGAELTIEDCAAASASECTGQDKDPAAGKFSVTGLKWGDYKLTEKKAPAGYILDDTPHTFTVSGSELDKSLGSYTNEQKPQVALPLTGGTGSQIYLIGGAALLAAAGAIALLKGLRRRNRKH
ncbi:SpaA isopeptide-forming pilin-related protein [Brevibacterium sp. SIMBA_078]|uniref:SpaA isopeptide-forming pilin-related protein n=2 Tax=unclassified Brevibacterium TaxID=2614124 RepID=UPI0039782715